MMSLKQRTEYMIYMRTQLKRIEKYGGTLLNPLFTMFNSTPGTETLNDVSRLMYGSSIMVVFALE